jgi:hypothetical protein
MAHDVFISHSSKDKVIADAVCGTFEANGIRCWIAPRDVPPGSNWGASIVDAIAASRIMVLVFSDHANASGQIAREVECAANQGVTIVPIRIEDVRPARSLQFFLSNIHWLDALSPPLERRLQEIAGKIKIILQGEGTISQRPVSTTSESARPSPRSWNAWIVAGAVVLLLSLGIWFWRPSTNSKPDIAGEPTPRPFGEPALVGDWSYVTTVLHVEVHVEMAIDSGGRYRFRKFIPAEGNLELLEEGIAKFTDKKGTSLRATYTFPSTDQLTWLVPDYKMQVNYKRVGGERVPSQPLVGKWQATTFLLGLSWDATWEIEPDLSYRTLYENLDEGVFKASKGAWEAISDFGRPPGSGTYWRVTPTSFEMSDPFLQNLKFERVTPLTGN